MGARMPGPYLYTRTFQIAQISLKAELGRNIGPNWDVGHLCPFCIMGNCWYHTLCLVCHCPALCPSKLSDMAKVMPESCKSLHGATWKAVTNAYKTFCSLLTLPKTLSYMHYFTWWRMTCMLAMLINFPSNSLNGSQDSLIATFLVLWLQVYHVHSLISYWHCVRGSDHPQESTIRQTERSSLCGNAKSSQLWFQLLDIFDCKLLLSILPNVPII